ncbi:MAG: 2-oxo acid dehydrogenase subunit E2, partial [Myxococcales bacterium]|nr:2-oxo acid dehydrogenase subunit E2 [Myxococcales bacterium]
TSYCWRAQEGQEITVTPRRRRPSTFSMSNHGVMGSLFASPIIINPPESAILGIGALERRAVVVDQDGSDRIDVRPMVYVSLTIDHRGLDAFHCNRFLRTFVKTLEGWPLEAP